MPVRVQATVVEHDPGTGSGQVLLDDGRPLAYDGEAFAAGGARLLRVGQRVALEITDGHVTRVALPPFI